MIFIYRSIYLDIAGIVLCCCFAKINHQKQYYVSAKISAEPFGAVDIYCCPNAVTQLPCIVCLSELLAMSSGKNIASSFPNIYQVTARS